MSRHVPVLNEKTLAHSWGTLKLYEIDYPHSDGTRQTLKREVYDHGHAAAVLLYDSGRDTVVLVRQFRLPVQLNGDDPYLIEVCAGLLDGDDPETCVRREAMEETGVEAIKLDFAFTLIASPGSLTEKLSCYIGAYQGPVDISARRGLAEEGEDIEVLEMAFADAFVLIASGKITDAKTVALLQHLALIRLSR